MRLGQGFDMLTIVLYLLPYEVGSTSALCKYEASSPIHVYPTVAVVWPDDKALWNGT
jgi:hypothetical protein